MGGKVGFEKPKFGVPFTGMVSRRRFLQSWALAFPAVAFLRGFLPIRAFADSETWINDIHSGLNKTHLNKVFRPSSVSEIQNIISKSKKAKIPVCVAGGKHSMGGQQFARGGNLIDMSSMKRVRNFHPKRGLIEVEAGIQWPELVDFLVAEQEGVWPQWGIIQKQTGADRLSIGGALGSNVHGRGLIFKPFISDVESFVLVNAEGNQILCNREENPDLFRLAIGGYGLFGIITKVTLRLSQRQKVQRVVKITDVETMMSGIEDRITQGFLYGDFQFSTDVSSETFLREGVFSTYKPVDPKTEIKTDQRRLSEENWKSLLYFAHADKERVFKEYTDFYRSTNGQIYWSDTHQMSVYIDDYHSFLDQTLKAKNQGSEMITEVYVPREKLVYFLETLRGDFRTNNVDLIYGTIRLIEKDDESFLSWAKERFACVVMNLHVDHSQEGLAKAKVDFQRIIDRAIGFGGSYFLTYHRWARKDQVEACYPQFLDFLHLKKKYDPDEVFQSDWYRHYSEMFSGDF